LPPAKHQNRPKGENAAKHDPFVKNLPSGNIMPLISVNFCGCVALMSQRYAKLGLALPARHSERCFDKSKLA
jgi:hypothetical protein